MFCPEQSYLNPDVPCIDPASHLKQEQEMVRYLVKKAKRIRIIKNTLFLNFRTQKTLDFLNSRLKTIFASKDSVLKIWTKLAILTLDHVKSKFKINCFVSFTKSQKYIKYLKFIRTVIASLEFLFELNFYSNWISIRIEFLFKFCFYWN